VGWQRPWGPNHGPGVDAVDLTPLVFHHVAGEGIVNGDTVRAKVWSIAERIRTVPDAVELSALGAVAGLAAGRTVRRGPRPTRTRLIWVTVTDACRTPRP
jgi:hypothetical protein